MVSRGGELAAWSGRLMAFLTTLGKRAFRVAAVRSAALAAAALRGHGLVLVFHRIAAEGHPAQGLVTPVTESLLLRQIEALLAVGEIVPLEELLRPNRNSSRPRFALTFDDDYQAHYERALPILRELGVPATFFLLGRSLHGGGPLWFERLDHFIATEGTREAARWLGVDTDDVEALAIACENDSQLQTRLEELPDVGIRHLSAAEIRALADAGMTVGFHTLDHPLLLRLSDSELDDALRRGRSELEAAAGTQLRLFAYPHGKADRRVAERVRRAGFIAACTGRPIPVRPGDDPYLIGRWEPGAMGRDRFASTVAARLNGWPRGA